jgi:hypothetical protein
VGRRESGRENAREEGREEEGGGGRGGWEGGGWVGGREREAMEERSVGGIWSAYARMHTFVALAKIKGSSWLELKQGVGNLGERVVGGKEVKGDSQYNRLDA